MTNFRGLEGDFIGSRFSHVNQVHLGTSQVDNTWFLWCCSALGLAGFQEGCDLGAAAPRTFSTPGAPLSFLGSRSFDKALARRAAQNKVSGARALGGGEILGLMLA